MYNSSNSSLWYLRIAWELKEKGKLEDAKKTLQKLIEKDEKLVSIPDTFTAILFEMLIQAYEIDKEIFNFLFKKLVISNHWEESCIFFAKKRYNDISIQIPQDIKSDSYKPEPLAAIAGALVKFDKDTVRRYIDKAIEIVSKMQDDYDKSRSLSTIAKTQSKIRSFLDSVETINKILVGRDRHLPEIIEEMIRAGDNKYFKKIIIDCAYDISSTYTTIGLLFYAYKDQRKLLSETIGKLIH